MHLDVDAATVEQNWLGGAGVSRGALGGRTTHLPAGPTRTDEAAWGPDGTMAGGPSLKLKNHDVPLLSGVCSHLLLAPAPTWQTLS